MKPVTPRPLVAFQDHLVRLLGNRVEGRAPLVTSMLRRDASEATSYWLQLVVAIGIATLGLVVGSTAVVISAMLVAPLMGPIVGLAMGLAAGSPYLVLRCSGRIAFSVLAAIGGAGIITLLLPFHELNSEIASRTSPTILDLITAAFCALAGVYASLRPGSDTAATAAGTSIGISLVPPLCASGYGIGTAAWGVAGGAALLFLTNLVAIVAVGTVAFVGAGFNRVDVVSLERDELNHKGPGAPVARDLARRLARLFESRWGPALRFAMPFLLLASVYLPLRRALDEVAWEVRVRAAVRASIGSEPLRVVQSRVRVERHEVEVVIVILGTTEDANAARSRIEAKLRSASGVSPHLEIFAVPDAAAFAGLESTLLKPNAAAVMATPSPSPHEQLALVTKRVRLAVDELWPGSTAGQVLAVRVGAPTAEQLEITVVHLGAALNPDAAEALRLALTSAFGRKALVVDAAIPATPLTRALGDLQLIAEVASALRSAQGIPDLSICAFRPELPRRGRPNFTSDAALATALEPRLALHPRVVVAPAESWEIRFVLGECPAKVAGTDEKRSLKSGSR